MPEPGDLQAPGWLSRNWQPREPFDPTPWLQERYRRQVEQAKLPLEIQGMELRNKQAQLAIEHQGLVNDDFNMELNAAKEDLPLYREAIEQASKLQGGTINMPTPPFKSRQYTAEWMQRQASDAQTVFGKTLMQDQIELTKMANSLVEAGIDVREAMSAGPNGQQMWDRRALSDLANQAQEDKFIKAMELRKAGRMYYDANGNPVAGGGHAPAAVATFQFREDIKKQIADAEEMGDFDKADSLREGLRQMDMAHPELREKARYQAIVGSLRNIDRQLGDATLKSKWPELELKKAELQKKLESQVPPTIPSLTPTAPTAPTSGSKAYIWTPQGVKPK